MFTPVADSLVEWLHDQGKISDEYYNDYMAKNRRMNEIYWTIIFPMMIILGIIGFIINY